LKDPKCSNPIEVADYAVDMTLATEPAFPCWAPHTIEKRNRAFQALLKKYFRKFRKSRIELPKI
jgi:hypothetical protein